MQHQGSQLGSPPTTMHLLGSALAGQLIAPLPMTWPGGSTPPFLTYTCQSCSAQKPHIIPGRDLGHACGAAFHGGRGVSLLLLFIFFFRRPNIITGIRHCAGLPTNQLCVFFLAYGILILRGDQSLHVLGARLMSLGARCKIS